MEAQTECWRRVPLAVYDGLYEVSTLGRVRRIQTGRILQPSTDRDGYLFVNLKCKPLRLQKRCTVHRLVALAFLDNPENKPEVNHQSGVKADCSLLNLEWVTGQENLHHAMTTGLIRCTPISEADVLAIRSRYVPRMKGQRRGNAWKLAAEFDVPRSLIYRIATGHTPTILL
jgi:hypothetical protein